MDSWNSNRWTWKRAVRSDRRLSDSVKLLAVALCDEFAHHETGFCNPHMDTLAKSLGKDKRSIQRALTTLESAGWVSVKRAKGRGRASEICFKKGDTAVAWKRIEKVTHMSPSGLEKVTTVVEKGDSGVTPYNEPKPIQRKQKAQVRKIAYPNVSIRKVYETNEDSLNAWNEWSRKEGLGTIQSMHIRSSDANGIFFELPWMYPPTDPEFQSRARQYLICRIQNAEVRYAAE